MPDVFICGQQALYCCFMNKRIQQDAGEFFLADNISPMSSINFELFEEWMENKLELTEIESRAIYTLTFEGNPNPITYHFFTFFDMIRSCFNEDFAQVYKFPVLPVS